PLCPKCATSETTNRIRKIKNRILAIPADATATPVKPSTAAKIATMKKPIAQFNILSLRYFVVHMPSQRGPRRVENGYALDFTTQQGIDGRRRERGALAPLRGSAPWERRSIRCSRKYV